MLIIVNDPLYMSSKTMRVDDANIAPVPACPDDDDEQATRMGFDLEESLTLQNELTFSYLEDAAQLVDSLLDWKLLADSA